MRQKKVFFISFNNLTTDFWNQHLDLKHSNLWFWKDPKQAINNITTVWPDIVIVDVYWTKEPYIDSLIEILSIKSNTKIFCITPQSYLVTKKIGINQKLYVSRLDNELVENINESINSLQHDIKLIA